MKYLKKSHSALFIFVSIFILVGIINIPTTHAAVKNVVTGYAWSSNIGWIQFNPRGNTTDDVTISTTTVTLTTGDFSGYAWSSNIGWIKFGGLSNFPTTNPQYGDAKVNLVNGEVTGWARACAGTLPGDCTNMNSRTDGWDGWIELSGTSHTSPDSTGYYDSENWSQGTSTKGVTMDPVKGKFSGYAWGGEVVGWVNFNPYIGLPVICVNNCGGGGNILITGSCSITDSSPNLAFTFVPRGGTGTYTYASWSLKKNGSSITWVTNESSISYSPTSPGESYLAGVTVTDSSSPPNSGNIYCATTVATPAPQVRLWFDGKDENQITDWSNLTKPAIREGQSVTVKYAYDKGTFSSCNGYYLSPTPVEYSESTIGQPWKQSGVIDSDMKYTFPALIKGTYKLQLRCSSSVGKSQSPWLASIFDIFSSIFAEGPTLTDSNIVKIIVTKTSIEEI